MASKLHAAFARNDSRSAASLFSNDAGYEDMTLRAQILGRLAIERYLVRALVKLPAGRVIIAPRGGWQHGGRL